MSVVEYILKGFPTLQLQLTPITRQTRGGALPMQRTRPAVGLLPYVPTSTSSTFTMAQTIGARRPNVMCAWDTILSTALMAVLHIPVASEKAVPYKKVLKCPTAKNIQFLFMILLRTTNPRET